VPFNSFENYPMSWKPTLDKREEHLYQTLAGQLEFDIAAGVLKPGTKLPPQRELADYLDINLSTVAKAIKVCAQKGLLTATVGSGTYVAYNTLTSARLLSENRGADIVDMGATVPDASGNDILTEMLRKMAGESRAEKLFCYHQPSENLWQKEAAVSLMRYCGHHTEQDRILFANGGQNALTGVLAALFKRGQRIAVDAHTYPGIKTAASMLGILLEPVPQDEYGTDPNALELVCKNKKVNGIYIIPACHNPTTITMPQERRREIAQIAKKYDCVIIEDGTYQPLSCGATSVSDFAPCRSVYIVSLSKFIAPGLRMAFLSVPTQYVSAVSDSLYSLNVAVVPMMAELSARVIASGRFEDILENHRICTQARNIIVDRWLPKECCRGGDTDIFRWLMLPEKYSGNDFARLALAHGVRVYAAEKFAVGKTRPAHTVRLSICAPQDLEELERGLYILAMLIGLQKN
jgi:DNA-binding transcriptional MocR family regulator